MILRTKSYEGVPDSMADETKDYGERDARFSDSVSNVVENVPASITHKLHPMIEQYATLFKTGASTPVLKRPSDHGMEYEDVFFPALDGVLLEAWFIPTMAL